MSTGAREMSSGEPRDDASEFALEAHLAFLGHRRFSGEARAAPRPRGRTPAGEAHELDRLMAIFAGC